MELSIDMLFNFYHYIYRYSKFATTEYHANLEKSSDLWQLCNDDLNGKNIIRVAVLNADNCTLVKKQRSWKVMKCEANKSIYRKKELA